MITPHVFCLRCAGVLFVPVVFIPLVLLVCYRWHSAHLEGRIVKAAAENVACIYAHSMPVESSRICRSQRDDKPSWSRLRCSGISGPVSSCTVALMLSSIRCIALSPCILPPVTFLPLTLCRDIPWQQKSIIGHSTGLQVYFNINQ